MENIKQKIPIIIAGTVAGAVGLFLLYKYMQTQESTVSQGEQADMTGFIDQGANQESKMRIAREWMVQYVKTNNLNQLKCRNGVLNRQDFNSVQKTMEIYAKCVLYETRIQHQEDRIDYLRRGDIGTYVERHNEQLNVETQLYEEAQNDVKKECKIGDQIFVFSQMEYGQDIQSIRDAITYSLLSPFEMKRAFTKKQVKEIFLKSAQKVLQKINQKEVQDLQIVQQKDYILILFDTLFMDYAYIDYNIHQEEFRAAISRFNLLNDKDVSAKVSDIVSNLYEINVKFDEE